MIDYITVPKKTKHRVKQSRAYNKDDWLFGSDHTPVIAKIQFKEAEYIQSRITKEEMIAKRPRRDVPCLYHDEEIRA